MDSTEKWSEVDADEEHIHTLWEHEETGDELYVSRFEDDTWDTFLNDRLIANRDEPHEAVDRAEKLMGDFSTD